MVCSLVLAAGVVRLLRSAIELCICGLFLSSSAVELAVVVSGRLGTCEFPEVAPDGVVATVA